MALKWYGVRTKPRSEYIAANALRVEGYEHFFPRIQAVQKRSGKEGVPLFPGYLFVRCDVDRGQWPAVGLLPGVLGWVRFENDIAWLPDQVMDEIKKQGSLKFTQGALLQHSRLCNFSKHVHIYL